MRRIQVVITDELDDRLEHEALLRHVSKSALVRDCVRRGLAPKGPIEGDPLWRLVGVDDGDPIDDLDEVIYGR